jgi:hypothetical protein
VGGMAFSGISTTVVTPPLAAACVPVQKPSHSVRPGSLRWTWASTRPGNRILGEWSTYVTVEGKSAWGTTSFTMEMIFPVREETVMVAGEMMSELSGSVRTAREETMTVMGFGSCEDVGTVMMTAGC